MGTHDMDKETIIIIVALLISTTVVINAQIAMASDQAVVKIHSNTDWSGSILDSSFDSATTAGHGDKNITIACTSFGIYSLAIQKQSASGGLAVSVIQDNKTLDSKTTTAAYGMVTLSGNCG